jgi:two-component system sensor histidine kinase KdpD
VAGLSGRRVATAAFEALVAVAASSGAVAALHHVAAAAGLSVVYLLGVLVIAVRRGMAPALATAVLSVLALNYFFITPVHQLSIRHSADIVALVVFLVVAVVVGRLAADARDRAQESAAREREAAARREEAEMLADVAAQLLAADRVEPRLPELGPRLARALGVETARIEVGAAPSSLPGLKAVSVPGRRLRVWVQLPSDGGLAPADRDRVLAALGAVIEVAAEREAVGRREADADTARRADAAKTAVLHAISHDLRSPLTAIRTAAEALSGPGLEAADNAELTGVVREESARLSRLVDDLLDLSRIQAQAVHPQLDWCDLRDVAASAAADVQDPRIRIELPADLPLVRADHAQMERVLANLLENAARLSPPDRPIRVTGGVGGSLVTVRVVDEGPGVPPGRRTSVFEPFERGARAPRPGAGGPGGGSGLGLAICKGFVEANGGRILLQPNPLGPGVAFAVSLPLVPQPVAARAHE